MIVLLFLIFILFVDYGGAMFVAIDFIELLKLVLGDDAGLIVIWNTMIGT